MSFQPPAFQFNKTAAYVRYWVAYVLLFGIIQGFPTGDIGTALLNELISLPPKLFFVTLVMEWLVNRYLLQRRFIAFTLIYVFLITAAAILQRLIDNYIILEYVLVNWKKDDLFHMPTLLYTIIKLQFVVTVPLAFLLFYYWMEEKNTVQRVQAEKMEAELRFLKSQFHPHFIFNVLNNLYSSVLQQSPDAPRMIMKFASLLRYSLYESERPSIALEQELQYIRDYMELQLYRLGNRVELSFHVEGDTRNMNIIPFILVPFVENSFKHFGSTDRSLPWITIYVEVKDGELTFKIENSMGQKVPESQQYAEPAMGQGLGLDNVRRRLELVYPRQHSLKINAGEERFFVCLKLKPDLHES
ncbi:histidine kinase [Flavihumibacter rivuli]|uniref:sensor histidine kinase n=1 Tax=Flavihumibacter rivuli TaxID=2838156 RepID=UPI001BDF53BF|nr:histidine kinase [Flavihumibacter rivuli]ULQ55871.1 histidine kinase [Flavihumibacter rivuli]